MSSNSWILVTGANRGLGYATVKKLVSDGESVIVGARTQASGAPASCASRRTHEPSLLVEQPISMHKTSVLPASTNNAGGANLARSGAP